MNLEELKSNLHALKQLYGLLRKDGNCLPNSTSNMLDDKSRLLLKDLLDRAAENVFKIHSEVLGAQAGLSLRECSEKAQQLGDLRAQLPTIETSDVLQICENDQNSVEFTEFENDCRLREPRTQRLSFTQPTQWVAASELGNRHKYCRVCQRRILRHSTEFATCDTRNGAKITALSQQIRFPESSGSAEDSERRETTHFDCISSGIGSTDSSSNRRADGVESRPVPELTEETTEENKCHSYLSNQASDAIKQIEVRILDLQRGLENLEINGINAEVPISCAAQQELFDRMNDTVSQVESTRDVVMEKTLMVARNEPSKSEFSAIGVNDWQQEIDNKQCKGTKTLNQLPSTTRLSPMEMELLKLTASSPLQLLPHKKTMTSPVSSQMIGRCTGLAPGMQIDIKNPYEEIKRQNHMMDWTVGQKVKSNVAKLEPDYATTSDHLKPSHLHNCYCFSSEDNKISKRVPAAVTCLPHEINEVDLRQNQATLEEDIMKPGACPTPMQRKICKDYMKNQNTWALDSRHKVNQFLRSQSKKGFTGEIKKWRPSPQHKADQFPARRILQHKHESDTSLSSNSSQRKSQQTSMSYSGSEVYYPMRQVQRCNYVNSSTRSENDMYSPSGESQVRYGGVSSRHNEVYSCQSSDRPFISTSYSSDERKGNSLLSSASSSQASYTGDSETESSSHASYTGGSETEGYSPYNQPRFQHHWQPRDFSVGSTSTKKIKPSGVYVSSRRTNLGKKIGVWKKLKGKLSVIFHHHHHHFYHPQHTNDDEDLSSCKKSKIYGKLPFKHTANNFSHLTPNTNEKQPLEKIGKSVIHGRDSKKQHKPVNALMGGLFKHIRHSKRSKLSAKHIKPLMDDQYDGNKVSAKLNWLKILQRHRKAKKLEIGYKKR